MRKQFSIFNFQFSISPGFTLIELMVVFTVLGVLAGIVLINVNPLGQARKEKDMQRKADLAKIQSMLERYRSEVGQYPSSLTCGDTLTSPDGNISYGVIPCADGGEGQAYMRKYTVYTINSQNVAYCLRACFVNITDTARDEINPAYCSGSGCNNPTPAQLGSNCAALPNCNSDRRSYTVLSP